MALKTGQTPPIPLSPTRLRLYKNKGSGSVLLHFSFILLTLHCIGVWAKVNFETWFD